MKALALQGFATSRDEGPLADEDEITIPVGTLTNLQASLLRAVIELDQSIRRVAAAGSFRSP